VPHRDRSARRQTACLPHPTTANGAWRITTSGAVTRHGDHVREAASASLVTKFTHHGAPQVLGC